MFSHSAAVVARAACAPASAFVRSLRPERDVEDREAPRHAGAADAGSRRAVPRSEAVEDGQQRVLVTEMRGFRCRKNGCRRQHEPAFASIAVRSRGAAPWNHLK